MTLKEIREERGMTQTMLAQRLGVTAQNISLWERGKTRIPEKALNDIARILEVSPDIIDIETSGKSYRRNRPRAGKYEAFQDTIAHLHDIPDYFVSAFIDNMLDDWREELRDLAGLRK